MLKGLLICYKELIFTPGKNQKFVESWITRYNIKQIIN